MKQAVLWGSVFGLIAFIANILLPGCLEPFFDLGAAFLAALLVVRRARPVNRRHGLRLGLATGLVSGIVITLTDMLASGLLAAGYLYKDRLPWINLPDLTYLNSIFGNAFLVLLVVSLCLGMIKIAVVLIGGATAGWLFSSSKINR